MSVSCYVCFAHITKWKIPLTCVICLSTFLFSSFSIFFMQMLLLFFILLVQPYTLNCLLHFDHSWYYCSPPHVFFLFPMTGKSCFKRSIKHYLISWTNDLKIIGQYNSCCTSVPKHYQNAESFYRWNDILQKWATSFFFIYCDFFHLLFVNMPFAYWKWSALTVPISISFGFLLSDLTMTSWVSLVFSKYTTFEEFDMHQLKFLKIP